MQWFALRLLTVSALVAGATAGAADAASPPPHLILYVIDDLGFADVGVYGPSDVPTPNIDTLAQGSAVLSRFYVQPVCSPTRSTLMTGRYVHRTGFYQALLTQVSAGLPADVPTLADTLGTGGYATHMIGKWHLGYSRWSDTPTLRGFESYFGYHSGAEEYYNKTFTMQAVEDANQTIIGYDFWDDTTAFYGAQGGYSLTQYHQRSLEIIRDHDPSRPLFLYYAHQTAHAPVTSPPPHSPPYEDRCDASTSSMRKTACAQLAYLDDTVGEFVAALQSATSATSSSLWENTVLWFMTDNGGLPDVPGLQNNPFVASGGCNWPLRGTKATVFEGGVRGVGFVGGGALPEAARGTTRNALVHSTDVFATFVRLATAGTKSGAAKLAAADTKNNDTAADDDKVAIDGRDQWDMIAYGSAAAREEVLVSVYSTDANTMGAIIRGDLKLISGLPPGFSPLLKNFDHYFSCPDMAQHLVPASGRARLSSTGYQLLFNLTADPEERVNLAASPSHRDEMVALQDALDAYNSQAVPMVNTTRDPRADEACLSNNFTMVPWLE